MTYLPNGGSNAFRNEKSILLRFDHHEHMYKEKNVKAPVLACLLGESNVLDEQR